MALNLSDPSAIVAAYESITEVANDNNWLLLKYSNYDELFLFDHGSGGLRELKSKVQDLDHIFIAFYREEVDVEPGFIIINYIPHSISGVKRARALVHSRRMGAVFKKHQTTLTIEDLSQLTLEAIQRTLDPEVEGPRSSSSSHTSENSQMGRLTSQPLSSSTNKAHPPIPSRSHAGPPSSAGAPPPPPVPKQKRAFPTPTPSIEPVRRARSEAPPLSSSPPISKGTRASIEPIRRSVSESQNPSYPSNITSKPSNLLSNFIRRRKKSQVGAEVESDENNGAGPPPIPVKDRDWAKSIDVQQQQQQQQVEQYGPTYTRSNYLDVSIPQARASMDSLTELGVISHAGHDQDDGRESARPGPPQTIVRTLPLRGKWAAPEVVDVEERLRRRKEAEKQRKEEEEKAIKDERRRKEEAKRRKEEERKDEIEEEELRRMALEDELRRITVERRYKDQVEKQEEERKRKELEERRRVDRERRMEEHKKLEAWRREQARAADETARRAEEARRKEEVERKKKIQVAEEKVKRGRDVESLVAGWATIQTDDSVTWKRRFYKFIGTAVYFYRSPQDTQEYLDKVELRNKLRGLREWNEGYEDLQAIPYSFAIEFKDDRRIWSIYADSEEEKFKLLGLLHYAAGL